MKKKFNEVYDSIDNALEISSATLSMVVESMYDENVCWVLNGVNDQLEKIRDNVKIIDKMVKEKAVTV